MGSPRCLTTLMRIAAPILAGVHRMVNGAVGGRRLGVRKETMDDLSGAWGSGVDTICSMMGRRGQDREFTVFPLLGDGACVGGGKRKIGVWILFVARMTMGSGRWTMDCGPSISTRR